MNNEFFIKDPNWRKTCTNHKVMIAPGVRTKEHFVYLAIEKLTPVTQNKYGRNPILSEIVTFVRIINGE